MYFAIYYVFFRSRIIFKIFSKIYGLVLSYML